MPSDDYAPVGGGALRIKGAKVKKHKKKSKKTDLEKNLSTGESSRSQEEGEAADENDSKSPTNKKQKDDEREEEQQPERHKTEAEKRFDEVRRKKLLELSESASSRPELLKTHKERVEELNTYLSKLSEHHDMPKIGPG